MTAPRAEKRQKQEEPEENIVTTVAHPLQDEDDEQIDWNQYIEPDLATQAAVPPADYSGRGNVTLSSPQTIPPQVALQKVQSPRKFSVPKQNFSWKVHSDTW